MDKENFQGGETSVPGENGNKISSFNNIPGIHFISKEVLIMPANC